MNDQEAEASCPNKNPTSLTQLLDLTKVSDLEPTMEGKARFPEERTLQKVYKWSIIIHANLLSTSCLQKRAN